MTNEKTNAGDEKKARSIQARLKDLVKIHTVNDLAAFYRGVDQLMMEAADRIEELETENERLQERIDIMSEDQYKSSEIRFP